MEMGQEMGVTLFMNLLAAFNVLLFKYTRQEDIVVGSVIAGRRHDDLKNIIGMFVNTLPFRTRPGGMKRYQAYLEEVKQASLEAFENQDLQFEALVELLKLDRDPSRNPLFDVCLTAQTRGTGGDATQGEMQGRLRFTPYEMKSGISKFDLTVNVAENDGALDFYIEYATALFKRETVLRLGRHLANVVRAVSAVPGSLLADIDILSQEERERVLVEFNRTTEEFPVHKTLHQLFGEQVERTPDIIGVEGIAEAFGRLDSHGVSLTYRELDRRAEKVAGALRQAGISGSLGNGIVALLAHRSVEMVVGMLGILKAGGAYLPMAPNYPEERIRYILEDSGAEALVTMGELSEKLPGKIRGLKGFFIWKRLGGTLFTGKVLGSNG